MLERYASIKGRGKKEEKIKTKKNKKMYVRRGIRVGE